MKQPEVAVQASGSQNATGENPNPRINLDPYNQEEDCGSDWQTIPILSQYKRAHKRMRKSDTPSPDRQIPIQNQFSRLIVDEKVQEAPTKEKVNKPPPIVLYGITNVTKLRECIEQILDKSEYSFKIVTKNQLRVTTASTDTYKKLMTLVREKNLIGHTFIQKSERPYRFVIKNLHPSTPLEAIKEAVESTGNVVKGEIINAKHGSTKTPLSTWFVNLEPSPNNEAIKTLKYIYHTSVKIEEPKRQKSIPQCKRCQQYGHTRNYCMRPYRCVKCAESHNTADCPKKDRTLPAKCALCLGDHAANYKGCKVFKEIRDRKFAARQQPIKQTTQDKAKQMYQEDDIKASNSKLQSDKYSTPTYAQATAGTMTNLEKILSQQAEKLDRLIDQMGNLMGLLTTIVTKLVR